MKKGYVQVYTGDGKGKTTASLGLALRCSGRDNKVLFVQFMKTMMTGELFSLEKIEDIIVKRICATSKFSFDWTEQETADERKRALKCLEDIKAKFNDGIDLLILDEALGAISAGVLKEEEILKLIDEKPEKTEIVITGRDVPDKISKRADLITEMKPIKHYMDKGVNARKGIEF